MKSTLLSTVLFLSIYSFAQPGSLDPSFGTDGKVCCDTTHISRSLALQPDGKVISLGVGTFDGQYFHTFIGRYNTDGSTDTSFGTSAGIRILDTIGAYRNVFVESQGTLLITGYSWWTQEGLITRYNEDGTLNSGLNGTGTVSLPGQDIRQTVLQPDQKILTAGYDELNSGYFVRRFETTGQADNTFNTNTASSVSQNTQITDMDVQADGKIVVLTLQGIYRLTNTGQIDPTFGTAGFVDLSQTGDTVWLYNIAVHADQRISLSGYKTHDGTPTSLLIQLQPNGQLNNAFGTNGINEVPGPDFPYWSVNELLAASDNSLIKVAMVSPNDPTYWAHFALIKHKPDGSIDDSFGTNGLLITLFTSSGEENNQSAAAVFRPTGELLVAGGDSWLTVNYRFAMAQYEAGPSAGMEEKDLHFTLYPNPTSGQFTVTTSQPGEQLLIRDISGKIVQTVILTKIETTIDLGTQPSGVYFLHAGGTTQMIVKQ